MRKLWAAAAALSVALGGVVAGGLIPPHRLPPAIAVEGRALVRGEGAAAEATIPLDEALAHARACREGEGRPGSGCSLVVYLWSPLMPLSRAGIDPVRRATEALAVDLAVVDVTALEERARALFPPVGRAMPRAGKADVLAAEMLAAGATLHSPSLLVYTADGLSGGAILGFKSATAYRTLIERRLRIEPPRPERTGLAHAPEISDSLEWTRVFPVAGRPGVYFRSVPGRGTIAYEAGSRVYLLDLADGSSARAPGEIDFVPSPDGRLFVTPGRNRSGLEFYDAAEVFAGASRGTGQHVEPISRDRQMRDQYPSVGILETRGSGADATVVYRVLTSWFNRIAYRDYDVRRGAGGRLVVRPLGGRVTACPHLSTPIISPDGRLIAARNEEVSSTRIFRLGSEANCREVVDLGVQTGKVAWSPDGGRLAFAIPRGAAQTPGEGSGSAGIFVYDRGRRSLHHVPGSEDASRLAFPEFVGADSLSYLVTPERRGDSSVFRLVCCFPARPGER